MGGGAGREWDKIREYHWHTLPCVKQLASGKLLYSTGSSAWCSMVTQMGWDGGGMGRDFQRERIYICVCVCIYIQLIHFIVQQNLTQHCKTIIFQVKKLKEKNRRVLLFFQPAQLIIGFRALTFFLAFYLKSISTLQGCEQYKEHPYTLHSDLFVDRFFIPFLKL